MGPPAWPSPGGSDREMHSPSRWWARLVPLERLSRFTGPYAHLAGAASFSGSVEGRFTQPQAIVKVNMHDAGQWSGPGGGDQPDRVCRGQHRVGRADGDAGRAGGPSGSRHLPCRGRHVSPSAHRWSRGTWRASMRSCARSISPIRRQAASSSSALPRSRQACEVASTALRALRTMAGALGARARSSRSGRAG